jgi:hypothetical protein
VANPTNADRKDAAEIGGGTSPSTVRGWKERGYGSAEPLERSAYLAHFRALTSLMSTGRDGDVVTLQMADKGFACRRLPDVLAKYWTLMPGERDSDDADDLIEYLKDAPHLEPIRSAYGAAVEAVPIDGSTNSDELRRVLLGSALLPVAQKMVDEPLAAGDLVDHSSVQDAFYRMIGLPVDWESDNPMMLDISLDGLKLAHSIVRDAVSWRDQATPSDMVRGVKAAAFLMQGIESLGIVRFSGEEERWHWIGRSVPTAEATLRHFAKLVRFFGQFPGLVDELPAPVRNHLAETLVQDSELEIGRDSQKAE